MKRKIWAISGLLLAVSLSAVLASMPLAGVCATPAGLHVQGWLSAPLRWLFWPVMAVLCFGEWRLWTFAERCLAGSRWRALAPLAWLPAAVLLPHGLAAVDCTLAGLVLPLGGTYLAAVCLERALRPALDGPSAALRHPHGAGWAWFGATAVFLVWFFFRVAEPQAFTSGDVRHYRIQVENLLERGTLDLTGKIQSWEDPAARAGAMRGESHMAVNADGRIYSCHSFGFPLLAWPFSALLGRWADGILLALLGAAALCGVRAACSAHGASRVAADTAALLTGLSFVWVYTAMSYLPEMLGFGLMAWAFWAIPAQGCPGRRWAATAVSALACGYLPVAHIRFLPAAGLLALCFGIEGLLVRDEPFWKGKFPRLGVYSLVCFAAWGALWAAHAAMFKGTAPYDYSEIAGNDPLAMWAMFADRRGVVSVVPAVSVFLVATVAALFRRDAVARHAAMALAVVAATLWFCCSVPSALGGACLNGRYFYNAIPVLLPFFAMALSRAGRPGRRWMLFLALLPVFYFVFLADSISGSRLIRAPDSMRSFLNFSMFWEPYGAFYDRRHSPVAACVAGSVFSAALFGLACLACTRRGGRKTRIGAASALLAFAFVSGWIANRLAPPKSIGAFDVLMGERHFHDFRLLGGGDAPSDFFAAFRGPSSDHRAIFVLTDDSRRSQEDAYRVQYPSNLEPNDWQNRPLRWGKTRSDFTSFRRARGFVACRATGRVVRGTARLALQIDGVPGASEISLPEGPFDVVFRVRVYRGNGGGNFLLALEDDVGEAVVEMTEFAPCPKGLPGKLGGFPPGCTLVEIP